jgi:hypothetical protein
VGHLYFDQADGNLYFRNSTTGAVTGPLGTGGSTPALGSPTAVYLEAAPRGNDGTGTRGDSSKPFATLQAALNACVDFDTIFVGVGDFHQGAVSTVWPAALNNLTIKGKGSTLSRLTGLGGAVILPFTAPAQFFVLLDGLSIETKGIAGRCILANGTGYGGAYFDQGLYLRDVRMSSDVTAVEAKFVSRGALIDVNTTQGGDVTLDTSNFTLVRSLRMDSAQTLTLRWDDDAADRPSIFRQELRFHDSDLGTIALSGQPWVYFCKGNRAVQMVSPSLTAALSGAPANVEYHGEIEEVIISGIPITPYPQTWNFDQTHFRAPGGKAEWGQTGVTVNRQIVSLRGATGPGQSSAGGPTNVTAKAGIDLYSDISGLCNLATTLDGTHTPRRLNKTGNMVNGVAAIGYGLTAASAPHHAYASVDIAGTGGMSITSTATTATITADNAPLPAGANVTVYCVWDI